LGHLGFVPVKVSTTGISLARLRRGLAAAPDGQGSDEQLREQIEGSPALRAAKRTADAVLGAARSGDTIKGRFELRATAAPGRGGG
jgi:hypothetical protein